MLYCCMINIRVQQTVRSLVGWVMATWAVSTGGPVSEPKDKMPKST